MLPTSYFFLLAFSLCYLWLPANLLSSLNFEIVTQNFYWLSAQSLKKKKTSWWIEGTNATHSTAHKINPDAFLFIFPRPNNRSDWYELKLEINARTVYLYTNYVGCFWRTRQLKTIAEARRRRRRHWQIRKKKTDENDVQ